MISELVKSIDSVKKKVVALEKEILKKEEENELLSKKNKDLEEEIVNLSKVSMVASLSKQIDKKNSQIEMLEKQIVTLKSKNTKALLDNESDHESINEEDIGLNVEEGYELILHDDVRLLKNIETRKLYYIGMNGSKGKYAGKATKKGKIKLKD